MVTLPEGQYGRTGSGWRIRGTDGKPEHGAVYFEAVDPALSDQ